jgi:hypothetical protein
VLSGSEAFDQLDGQVVRQRRIATASLLGRAHRSISCDARCATAAAPGGSGDRDGNA